MPTRQMQTLPYIAQRTGTYQSKIHLIFHQNYSQVLKSSYFFSFLIWEICMPYHKFLFKGIVPPSFLNPHNAPAIKHWKQINNKSFSIVFFTKTLFVYIYIWTYSLFASHHLPKITPISGTVWPWPRAPWMSLKFYLPNTQKVIHVYVVMLKMNYICW